jgi:AcrR family transcriptional regulator
MAVEEQPRTSVTKATLLEEAIDFSARHGLSGVSLRQMAEALGTSHRMLIYHFGSKEGLLVAIVNEMEARQREQMAALDADPSLSPREQLRRMWRQLADPAMWPHERLFFEVYGQALQGRPHTTQLLDTAVESWLEPVTEIGRRSGLSRRQARANARLALAVVRGLLLDLLATGDRKGCDDAMERFISDYVMEDNGSPAGR